MAIKWKFMAERTTPRAAPTKLDKAFEEAALLLPDLSAVPGPLDKAHVLLESAAEVEHMLLIQYLYAALTLKTGTELDNLTEPRAAAVRSWQRTLMTVAIEEMGHLLSVQNLRLVLGAEPIFERESFPPKVDVYPFELHLEPLSQASLAKYVLAEAPLGSNDDLRQFEKLVGSPVHHVGVIYALLYVLFSTKDDLPNEDAVDQWDLFVAHVARKCGAIDRPQDWHLPPASLRPESLAIQGDKDDFPTHQSGFFVGKVSTMPEGAELLRRIGVQGEAPVETPEHASHYRRFRGMFEGAGGLVSFPAAGEFVPCLSVATDPKLADYDGDALTKAIELEAAYDALIRSLKDYLSPDKIAQRPDSAQAALDQMTEVRRIARDLVQLPQRAGAELRASPVFAIPPSSRA